MNILAFNIGETLMKLVQDSGFAGFFADGGWRNLIMIAIACVLLYLGIVKKFEPLLLVGIAFGCAADQPARCRSVSTLTCGMLISTATISPSRISSMRAACWISSTSVSRPVCIRR